MLDDEQSKGEEEENYPKIPVDFASFADRTTGTNQKIEIGSSKREAKPSPAGFMRCCFSFPFLLGEAGAGGLMWPTPSPSLLA
ncbi:hypothetical protein L6452_22712 [Arctium lappa]|uniref:Uncharacterized protein n=1 Tax=Arctium lappa TaxID=4217 RepID=A0ACB9B175_ARCLA|nr:hypothetical protein L6452_22712 [Arctium lappa]